MEGGACAGRGRDGCARRGLAGRRRLQAGRARPLELGGAGSGWVAGLESQEPPCCRSSTWASPQHRPHLAGDAPPLPIPLAWPLWCLCAGNKAAPQSRSCRGSGHGTRKVLTEAGRGPRGETQAQHTRVGSPEPGGWTWLQLIWPTWVRISLEASFSGVISGPRG